MSQLLGRRGRNAIFSKQEGVQPLWASDKEAMPINAMARENDKVHWTVGDMVEDGVGKGATRSGRHANEMNGGVRDLRRRREIGRVPSAMEVTREWSCSQEIILMTHCSASWASSRTGVARRICKDTAPRVWRVWESWLPFLVVIAPCVWGSESCGERGEDEAEPDGRG